MVTFPIRTLFLSGFLALFAFHFSFGQVVFKEVPDYEIRSSDSLFFDLSDTRSLILLNGKWSVRPADDDQAQKVTVSVPSVFEGEGELIFEKEFELSKAQISENTLEIVFFSINYTADISLNNTIIYRHSGGEYPFRVSLPRDILRSDGKNLLSLKMIYELNSKNSIPQKQRFLFPQNYGGIVGDVYIHLKPDFYIAKEKIKTIFSADYKSVSLQVESIIKNNMTTMNSSGIDNAGDYSLIISITDAAGNTIKDLPAYKFTLDKNRDIAISQKLDLSGAVLWLPETPLSYILKQQLFKEDSLVDTKQKSVALFDLKSDTESIKLNGSEFILKGTTYHPTNNEFGRLLSYTQMENDITLIKEAGFNCVRFAAATIHPYYLQLCQIHGLFAFIELPISGVPSGIAEDQSFISRGKDFLFNYVSFYGDYPSLAAIGLGESYLPDMEAHISLISSLAASVKEKSSLLTFASFFGKDLVKIDNLDLYGIEFFDGDLSNLDETINNLQTEFGKGKIFISSATYPVNIGGSDGYVNDYSFEAQAKFFEEFLTFAAQNKTAAFFLNTFVDYRGDYSSFICGFNENNLYRLGLIDENRSKNRISYKVVFAKLNNLDKVTIPIGSKKDDSPMIFIVFGLLIAIFMGVLVNSGRKFREDASRALLRPYNFFSDVRDQRIISASHSTLLGLVIAAVVALIVSNILFHLKTDLVFEHLLIAFASPLLMKTANYLAWHPFMSLVWLTLFNIVLFVIIALVIKIASIFINTRVYIVSVYFTFIWALLPVVLLIPVGIILYRVLLDSSINIYIYLGLGFVILWILYRLMKGIHVLFDTNPGTIYFYSSLFLIAIIGSILFYFELKHSTLQYLLFTFKQFNIL